MTVEQIFLHHFGQQASATGVACGRVNLIGEHIDYNGGVVLPAPIKRFVEVAIRYGDQSVDEIYSEMFDERISLPIDSAATDHWSDYIVGTLSRARQLGSLEHGVRVVIKSDIPYGAGVSSSSAAIIATFRAIEALTQSSYDKVELAQWAQAVENDFIGVPCGIMDQMAISVAEPNYALALNTHSLEYTNLELPSGYHFAVLFTGVTRRLDEGRYAVRRAECESAAAHLGVPYICTMSEQQSNDIESLPDPLNKRARHVFSEHQRVLSAIDALKKNDVALFAEFMNQSHRSMRDDFEISTDEVDGVVKSAREFGALGARMTGGGFGGCIVACIANQHLDDWKEKMQSRHIKSKFIA